MVVRKIKPEELKRTVEFYGIAFENSIDNTKSAMQFYQDTVKEPKTREDFYCLEKWAAFEDDAHTMMSCLLAKPFSIFYDGNFCSMTGIGGVSTLPQYRRRGGIRACFSAALPDMYENEVLFSFLYPFSTAYYRKFGYEICCERFRYIIALKSIPSFPVTGSCFLSEFKNNYLDDIKQVYEIWMNKYNLMVKNEDFEYAWLNEANPAASQDFTYVYKSQNGTPKGFMRFLVETDTCEKRTLKCLRFLFTDVEGFQGLMNLAKSFSSDHEAIQFELPSDLNIIPLLPEWSSGAGTCEKIIHGMVRVIHVKKVLERSIYLGSGNLCIQISDPVIDENNQCFSVHFKDNKAMNVSITDCDPDISMTINDFSRLIVGTCDDRDFTFMESIQIHKESKHISKVFYRKPNMIVEYF